MSTRDNKISSVLLVGGTHGNELTGIHLVKHLKNNKIEADYSTFELDFLIANPEALKENKRYIDVDLNRSFKIDDLNNPQLANKEAHLARNINRKYGPKLGTGKSKSKIDFIIDLHTSTSNMQTNIVITRIDKFHLQLASYLKRVLRDVTITSEAELLDDHHFLESIAPYGVLIEIGPIAQGTIEYPILEITNNAVLACLEFVELFNHNDVPELPEILKTYNYYSNVDFPTDSLGEISASVHPNLLGKAFPLLEYGDPIFKTFDGKDVLYNGKTTHLAFINEAAYYDQKIAMCLCEETDYSLKTNQKTR